MGNAEKGIENADKALAAIEGLEHAVRKLKTQCMKAIGDPEFCECIGEWSPIGLTFMGYVSITAGTKEQFKYDQVSTENKELFDRTRAARDKCVSWKGKGSERAKN